LDLCSSQGLNVCRPQEFVDRFGDIKADILLWQSNIEHLVDLRGCTSFVRDRSKRGTVLYVNGLTPAIIREEARKGCFVKAHFLEHINYFPIQNLHRFMAQFDFHPLGAPKNSHVLGKTLYLKDKFQTFLERPPLEKIWYRSRTGFARLYTCHGE